MTWSAFESSIQWARTSSPYSWQALVGGYTEFSALDKAAILAALSNLYTTSTTARGIMDSMVSSGVPLRIGQSSVDSGKFTGTGLPAAILGFNLGLISGLYYINENGKLVQEIPALTFIHEIAHASQWANTLSYEDPDDALLNNTNYDQDGAILPIQNAIAQEMNWATNRQASYYATVTSSDARFGAELVANHEYTNKNPIDNARFGTSGSDNLDHSSNTVKLKDLFFGFDGNDTISAGDGDDYAYGGDGADQVGGGAGNDVLYGEDGNDTLTGGDGDDLISGGAGTDTIDGGNGWDAISFLNETTGLTASYSAGVLTYSGADSLTSIEGILTTNLADTLTIDAPGAGGLFATMGGDDNVTVSSAGDGGLVFLYLGDGDDTVDFQGGADDGYLSLFLIGGDAGDSIIAGGFTAADIYALANDGGYSDGVYSFFHRIDYTDENGYDRWTADSWLTISTDVAQLPGWIHVSYTKDTMTFIPEGYGLRAESTTDLYCDFYIYGFEDGDYGLPNVISAGSIGSLSALRAQLLAVTDDGEEYWNFPSPGVHAAFASNAVYETLFGLA